jgi:hypothetical protein
MRQRYGKHRHNRDQQECPMPNTFRGILVKFGFVVSHFISPKAITVAYFKSEVFKPVPF